MTVDWEVDSDQSSAHYGDLRLVDGDAVLVDGARRIAQEIETTLRAFQNEWAYNTDFGTPYFQSILGKKVVAGSAEFDAIIKSQVIDIDGVNRFIEYASTFNSRSRDYAVTFTVDTVFGPVEFEGTLP
jgi:hypothetical protein